MRERDADGEVHEKVYEADSPEEFEKSYPEIVEKYDLKLDEMQADAGHRSEKTACALAEITKVFRNEGLRRSVRRARIREIMDAYELDESFLPPGVEELLEEEEFHDE